MIISTEPSGTLNVRGAAGPAAFYPSEQRELLEALARAHGFTLVDREERKSLLELVTEVDEDDNDYNSGSDAWGAWQDRCEALASAVSSALRFENDREV